MTDEAAHLTRKKYVAPPRRKICRADEVERMIAVDGRVWYAFTVAPGKEFPVETILRGAGYAAFVPVQYRLRRACSHVKKKISVPYVMASRYVFVGFDCPFAQIPWGWLFKPGLTQRVIGYHERPVGLTPAAMRQLFAVSKDSQASTLSALLNKSIQVGELVRIGDGPFRGFEGKLEAVSASHGLLTISLFGRPELLPFPLENIDPAA